MNYATFWQRFSAMWIDIFILMPIIVLSVWLQSLSKEVAIAIVVPVGICFMAYTIYCHGRFGQTVGKFVMGIRVVQTNGRPISWRQAWLRSAIDVLFSITGIISSAISLNDIPDAEYYNVGWMQRALNLESHQPRWQSWSGIIGQVWIWSELVVMLFNTRRRALHDFIAGTVVVAEPSIPVVQKARDI